MPQLRDSSNHGTGAPIARSEQYDGFARIFGIETEYGVSITGAARADAPASVDASAVVGAPAVVDAGQVAMMMFQPIVSRSRSTNTYLTNGARLYLDVGSHPEYATAEARDPLTALHQDLAGERIMAKLAQGAEARLRERFGGRTRVHVFKNNVDSAGHSFGCHENYLVRRFVPLEQVEHELLPFLITRQLYTGAGRVTDQGFELTQRADYLDEAISSATTRSRPMVNTRDEPHADPDEFRRLHVIIGDSNRSQWATWMKLAVTHLVLCVIEDAVRRGEPSGFERLAFADPGAANRAVSRDVTCSRARLALADGSEITALGMQRRYLDSVEHFVASPRGEAVRASLPAGMVDETLRQWRGVLADLGELVGAAGSDDLAETAGSDVQVGAAGAAAIAALSEHDAVRRACATLADRVDWAAKLRLFAALHARGVALSRQRLEQLDMDYHDVAAGRVYASLLDRGAMRRLAEDGDIDAASRTAPADTRAALRGAFVSRALDRGVRFSCDWTTLSVSEPVHASAVLIDPFRSTPTDDVARLMAALG
ncbi:proteasome accessory factor PafA2 family protein [Bifidobacterium jacchi]|uniref:Pup--protein ligase n=1 Tax=Bifidobacterium jacchi TaxID=2490545 RepID=A0A5N5RKD4_9BIFI|nr:proteasome accessory factor PafA2 family protein [Bifidobacterium jacchi]KAB5607559.1 Pup--protein ligase [Bifidobacterium jacchi]